MKGSTVCTQAYKHGRTIESDKNIKHAYGTVGGAERIMSLDLDLIQYKSVQSGNRQKDRRRLTTHAHQKDERGRGVKALCCSTNLLSIISLFSSFHNCAYVT